MKYQIGNILQKKGYLNKNKLAIAMTGKLFNISTVQTGFEFETGYFFTKDPKFYPHRQGKHKPVRYIMSKNRAIVDYYALEAMTRGTFTTAILSDNGGKRYGII